MSRTKAVEKAPFYLIAALYAATVGIGFGTDTPPLAPPALFLVALTITVIGHVLNAYQIASLVDDYPTWLFIIDLLLVGLLAWMFTLLAHPVAGGLGRISGGTSEDFTSFLASFYGDTLFVARHKVSELLSSSMATFFGLAWVFLIGLIVWHGAAGWVWKRLFVLNRGWVYAVGWAVFAYVAGAGCHTTRTVTPNSWSESFPTLSRLSFISVSAAVLILSLANFKKATYEFRKPATIRDLRRWLINALQSLKGAGSPLEVIEYIAKHHGSQIQSSKDLRYTWQRELGVVVMILEPRVTVVRDPFDDAEVWVLDVPDSAQAGDS